MVRDGQNIFDVCIQEFGTLEMLFEGILEPNKFGLNTKIYSGQELIMSPENKGNKEIKDFIKVRGIQPNNGQTILLPPVLGGSYSGAYSSAYY